MPWTCTILAQPKGDRLCAEHTNFFHTFKVSEDGEVYKHIYFFVKS